MDPSRFDRFSRGFATGATRRRLIQVLAGSAAGGLGLVGVRSRALSQTALNARLADLDLEEQSVVLFEGMAAIADAHHDSCASLSEKLQQYQSDNKATFDAIKAEQEAWDHTQRVAHAGRYGDRVAEASKTLTAALNRCQYVPGADGVATPVAVCGSAAVKSTSADVLALAGQDSCDCDSICPRSTKDCWESYLGCAAGDSCECCFTSYCHDHSECINNCESNECCSTPCSSATPPPPPGGE